jgi:hypothetical protein
MSALARLSVSDPMYCKREDGMPKKTRRKTLGAFLPPERIERSILLIRGHKVILDRDLAVLYGVTVGRLNEAVKRNLNRFPADFLLRLTMAEYAGLISQNAMSKPGRGGRRSPPYAFTEQGVAMLSSVLNSDRAIKVNIEIMRAFVRLRQLIASNNQLSRRLEDLERKMVDHDDKFAAVFDAIRELMSDEEPTTKPRIGFETESEGAS